MRSFPLKALSLSVQDCPIALSKSMFSSSLRASMWYSNSSPSPSVPSNLTNASTSSPSGVLNLAIRWLCLRSAPIESSFSFSGRLVEDIETPQYSRAAARLGSRLPRQAQTMLMHGRIGGHGFDRMSQRLLEPPPMLIDKWAAWTSEFRHPDVAGRGQRQAWCCAGSQREVSAIHVAGGSGNLLPRQLRRVASSIEA